MLRSCSHRATLIHSLRSCISGVVMKPRREPIRTTLGQASSEEMPTQQQRVFGQLKTAMLNLNKKHGTSTTTEVLGQILQSITVADVTEDKHPVYSDVYIDTELAVPPVPAEVKTDVLPVVLSAFPSWFSFDSVSPMETAHFGPLFSMDDERWKMYLLTRNDVVRVAEEAPHVYMDATHLRIRMHPKDDAALVFEIWKFMTKHRVINRMVSSDEEVDNTKVCSVPPQPAVGQLGANFTPVLCSSCGRECRFVCYKAIPSPDTPETPPPEDSDEEMKQPAESVEPTIAYFCHDCTPPFFEKIPLRLFIDEETERQISQGKFEEVGKDDLKSFIKVAGAVGGANVANREITAGQPHIQKFDEIYEKIFSKKPTLVKSWSEYSVMGSAQAATGLMDTLDPTMQEALRDAGSKIRGSVLIEQQVRNLMYGSGDGKESEQVPVCSVEVDRAFELIQAVFANTSVAFAGPVPKLLASSELYKQAVKTDRVHAELIRFVYLLSKSAIDLKNASSPLDVNKLESLLNRRIAVKTEYLKSRKSSDIKMTEAPGIRGLPGDIFSQTQNPKDLASMSSKQVKLVHHQPT